MCEEIRNPRKNVPTAMVGSVFINGILGFGFIIALLFNIGSIQAALSAETSYPIVQIFYNITRSKPGATAMSCALVVVPALASIPVILSSSRMLWALARDNGNFFFFFFFFQDASFHFISKCKG